jgi:hypothetical protein
MGVQWTSAAPPSPHRQSILILKPGESALATFIGEPHGVEIHWVERRSQPCLGAECPINHATNAPKWRAYAPAQVRRFLKRGECAGEPIGDWSAKLEDLIVELTEAHVEFVTVGKLRGLVVELHKPRGNVRQSMRIINTGKIDDTVPAPFDVKAVLCRLWNVRESEPAGTIKIHKTG